MAIQAKINFLQDNAGTSGNALTNLTLNAGDIFWVEIQLGDFRDNASGLVGSQLDLSWTANQFDALEYKITSNFVFSLGGDLTTDGLANNLRGGAIDGQLGQRIGDNQFERFAVVRFTVESNNTTLTPTSFTIGDVAPSNFALADASGVSVIANDDALTISENSPLTGSLLGNDIIGAGGQIVAVNGNAANVGQAITLTSGATVTVNADGTFSYNAANGSAGNQDTFTYSLSVFGNSLQPTVISTTDDATVTITITAPVNEAPTITSGATATFAENDPGTVYTVTANDPNGDTLTYSLDGIDAELFEINDSTGIVTFQTAPDFETPTDNGTDNTYNITVTASDGSLSDSQAVTITVTDVNEAPTAVALTSTTTTLAENTDTVSRIKVADIEVADDALGTNVLSLAGADSVLFEIDGTELYIKAGTYIDFETNPVLDVTVEVNDATIGATPDASTNLAIAVTDVNEAPTGVTLTNTVPTLAENTNTTSRVKVADIAITDDALGTETITLSGNDATSFEIDGSELFLKAGTNLDFETQSSYTVIVNVADTTLTGSNPITTAFTLNVTAVNEAPTAVILNNTVPTLAENTDTTSRVKVADIAITDDALGTNTITLSGNDASLFEVVGTELFLKAGTALDFETNPQLDVTVEVNDATIGATPDASTNLAIAVTDVNEFNVTVPSDSDGTNNTVAENAANGTTVGITANATDGDGSNNTITYSLTDDAEGRFAINASTGVVTVAGALDFETATSHNITVQAASADGSTSTETFAIAVTDVDEFDVTVPTDSDGTNNTVTENATNGASVGITANATDGDGSNNTITYSLTDDAGGRFAINASTGVVTVAGALDFETATSHNITVQAASADGSTSTETFAIVVTDINEAPTAVALTSTTTTLAENTDTVSRIKVADIEVTDDGLGTNALSLAGADSVLFEIDGTELYIKAGTNIDFETNPVLDVTVEVNDAIIGATPDASTNLAIAVTDVNEFNVTVPSDSDGTNNTVAENAANGTTVGITANATDGDGSNNTITYSLTDDAEGRFAINASTGVVTVAGALDFETATSHNIAVQAASSDGSTSTETFAITVTDVDEFDVTTPVDTDTTENTLAENAALNTAVGITADAIDADGSNNTVTYSLTDNAGGRFTINTNTGVVTLAAALDFETATSHNITVQAASADGSISTETFAIDVTDVNEVPIITSDATASFTENGTGTAYTVNATDPDGDILTYSLGGIDAALFDISNTGVITFKTTPDFENATDTGKDNTYNITITANDGSLSNSQAVAIGVVNVNEAPTAVALTSTTTTLAENADTVSRIKVADIEVIDDALGTNTITLSGSDAASFEVDSNELFLQANTSLDFETKSSYAVTVNVVDNTLSGSNPVTTDFTLSITDVDDVAPVITSGQSFNYDENQTSGFVIGTVAANDNVGITRFAITANNDNGYFAIDNTGVITLTATGAAAAANDFETSPNNFTLGVTASDAAENVSFVTGVNLQVNDVEDSIQNWNLDLDGDGIVGASSDGIILIRYMVHKALPFLFAGDDLIAGAISPNATRSLADIQEYLANAEAENLLDIDGDGIVGASSDGIIAIRYMVNQTLPFLFTGDDLIAGAISSDATRSLTDIQNYMAELSSSI